MKLDEAINILYDFNRWRRGEHISMPNPNIIGIAIDVILKYHKYQE